MPQGKQPLCSSTPGPLLSVSIPSALEGSHWQNPEFMSHDSRSQCSVQDSPLASNLWMEQTAFSRLRMALHCSIPAAKPAAECPGNAGDVYCSLLHWQMETHRSLMGCRRCSPSGEVYVPLLPLLQLYAEL